MGLKKTKYPVRIHSARPPGGDAPFSTQQLSQAVQNWHKFQKTGNPAFPITKAVYIPSTDVGIGHDPDETVMRLLLARTDLPNCGKPTNVYMQGPDVFATLDGVPDNVAQMCDDGQFDEVSAEIWPNYRTPDGKYHGPVFKRISLIGGANARQKGLNKKLPPFVASFADTVRGNRYRQQQVIAVFSEGPFMTRDQALAVLSAAGMPMDGIENVPDALVIWMAQNVPNNGGGGIGAPNPPAVTFADITRAVTLAVTPLAREITTIRQESAAERQATVNQEILTFAETTGKKKLFPHEIDPKLPGFIVTRLRDLSPDQRKREMDVILARPDLDVFAESMEQNQTSGGGTGGGRATGGGTGVGMTPERRRYLLSLGSHGRAKLANQDRQQQRGQQRIGN